MFIDLTEHPLPRSPNQASSSKRIVSEEEKKKNKTGEEEEKDQAEAGGQAVAKVDKLRACGSG